MNKKLIIALILVLVMVFTFVACKNSGDEGNESTDADTTASEITTDKDGFADFGSAEDDTTSGNTTGGKNPNNNGNNSGNGNDLVISPGDDEGAGFEDIEGNGNSGNSGGDIVIGDNNGKEDSVDWNELG